MALVAKIKTAAYTDCAGATVMSVRILRKNTSSINGKMPKLEKKYFNCPKKKTVNSNEILNPILYLPSVKPAGAV